MCVCMYAARVSTYNPQDYTNTKSKVSSIKLYDKRNCATKDANVYVTNTAEGIRKEEGYGM